MSDLERELLEALRTLTTAIGECCIDLGSDELRDAVSDAMDKGRAAIAKAEAA